MTKEDFIFYIIWIALGIPGYFIGGYWGGLISGACWFFVIMAFFGKRKFIQATKRIDKATRDILIGEND